jgi:hypothetical protein
MGALLDRRLPRYRTRVRIPVAAQLLGTTLPVPLPLRFASREGRRIRSTGGEGRRLLRFPPPEGEVAEGT